MGGGAGPPAYGPLTGRVNQVKIPLPGGGHRRGNPCTRRSGTYPPHRCCLHSSILLSPQRPCACSRSRRRPLGYPPPLLLLHAASSTQRPKCVWPLGQHGPPPHTSPPPPLPLPPLQTPPPPMRAPLPLLLIPCPHTHSTHSGNLPPSLLMCIMNTALPYIMVCIPHLQWEGFHSQR